MDHYTLLIFAWNDEVAGTQALHAEDLVAAITMARRVMVGHPDAAGYQLWQNGEQVDATFPRPRLSIDHLVTGIIQGRKSPR